MLDYDPTFNPPAPVVRVRVQNPDNGAAAEIRAQVDTGSFMTVIPESIARELKLEPYSRVVAGSVDCQAIQVSTFRVTLVVEGYVILRAEIAVLDRDDALLGRDALQHFILTLNGKEGKFDLVDP